MNFGGDIGGSSYGKENKSKTQTDPSVQEE